MLILGSLLWRTTNGGIVPPPPPPPADTGVKPSGGIPATLRVRPRTRQDVSESRQRFGITDKIAAQIIEDVAARQVERLERDEQKRFEELSRELELRKVEWDGRYLEALNAIREKLIDAEIYAHLQSRRKGEEEIMLLLMIAAAAA